jgi:hypothetical protein
LTGNGALQGSDHLPGDAGGHSRTAQLEPADQQFFTAGGPKLEIVINRYESRALGVAEEHITKALTRPAQWKIPNDYARCGRCRTPPRRWCWTIRRFRGSSGDGQAAMTGKSERHGKEERLQSVRMMKVR